MDGLEVLKNIRNDEKLKHRVGFHHQGYLPPKSSILQSTAIKDKIALNTKDGAQKWSTPIGPILTNNWGDGPRGTPTSTATTYTG